MSLFLFPRKQLMIIQFQLSFARAIILFYLLGVGLACSAGLNTNKRSQAEYPNSFVNHELLDNSLNMESRGEFTTLSGLVLIGIGEEEIKKLKVLALSGDKNASNELSRIYRIGLRDREEGLKWLKLAARQGHIFAIDAETHYFLRDIEDYPATEAIQAIQIVEDASVKAVTDLSVEDIDSVKLQDVHAESIRADIIEKIKDQCAEAIERVRRKEKEMFRAP